ncbi:hypothetical protein R50073_43450 [Maricurvus nonylphenolicus]|uniref:alpha/beta hydrolase n=1 Tax=Maricurvus nonylphenolicus TaxID=1008307 RepID=UPI0036F1EDBD
MSEPVKYPDLVMPDNVERTKVTVWSLGVPLDADVYRPKGLAENDKVPGIALTHGWGGDKKTAERYAAKFAASGMICISLTQSSWYGSAGTLVPVDSVPETEQGEELTLKVRPTREVVDPIDWVQNFRACFDYLCGEANVDTDRLGAWGTSYGGGTAAYATATDSRIKALTIQVPMLFDIPEPFREVAQLRATQIARGEINAIPQGIDPYGTMSGTPNLARMLQYNISEQAAKVSVPTLIVDAGNEEMFDIRQSGGAVHEVLKAKESVPTYYEVIEGIDHYGIYFDGFERGSQLQHDWFVKYL